MMGVVMKAIGAGLLWLASVTGAAAYFPVDIENHARWVVLDDLPLFADGRPFSVAVTNLRTNDLTTQPVLISAVCGTLEFHDTDNGMADFVLFYSVGDDGKMAMVGRPFFYGRVSERNFNPQYEAALKFCGNPAETPVIAGTEATGTAVIAETGAAAETEAAAVAAGP
jgi:hypothetical protein